MLELDNHHFATPNKIMAQDNGHSWTTRTLS